MAHLLSVDEALAYIVADMKPLPAETVTLAEAHDRVLADEVLSPLDLPPFDNSAMDGYAIRHRESAGASQENPVSLSVTQDIPAGAAPAGILEPGAAARIMTGAPLPAGATAVIPVEYTDDNWQKGELNALPAEVRLFKRVDEGENIRRTGENIAQGARVLPSGVVLRPADIGMLAAIGAARVSVIRKPKVVIVSSGDELVDVHDALTPGKIRDTNSYALAAQVRQDGGVPIRLPIARDSLDSIRALYRRALSIHPDMIISSAGVSVGAADLVRVVMDELGDIDFWRINMRPGKPLAYGSLQGLPFFGLPGNPVSSLVTFFVLVRPALARLAGRVRAMRVVKATICDKLRSDGRRSYDRVTLERVDGRIMARSTGIQSSGALMSLVLADGLAVIPEGVRTVPAGSELDVILLKPLDEAVRGRE